MMNHPPPVMKSWATCSTQAPAEPPVSTSATITRKQTSLRIVLLRLHRGDFECHSSTKPERSVARLHRFRLPAVDAGHRRPDHHVRNSRDDRVKGIHHEGAVR